MSAVSNFLSSYVLLGIFNFIAGLIFALQFLSFLAFCVYLGNETCQMLKGKSMAEWMKTKVFVLLIKYGIIVIVREEKELEYSKQSKKVKLLIKLITDPVIFLENVKQIKGRFK